MIRSFGFIALGFAWLTQSVVAATPPTGKYKVIVDKMQALQAQYPDYSTIFSLGQNDEGTEILGMRISINPHMVDPSKVGHIVVATHHGNEGACPPFTAYFIEQLLKRYASQELFRSSLAEQEWTIIPVLNVTGYNSNNRYEYGRDPNRDYPGPCNGQTGGNLKSIKLLQQFLTTRIFTGSLTVHGYVGALTYPWGVDADDVHTQDHNQFDQITKKAAAINGYRYGTSTDVVYPADNTYEDYAYWKHGMWSLLLEMRNGSQSDIESTTEATFEYFNQLESSPSLKNQFTGHCSRGANKRVDLHLE